MVIHSFVFLPISSRNSIWEIQKHRLKCDKHTIRPTTEWWLSAFLCESQIGKLCTQLSPSSLSAIRCEDFASTAPQQRHFFAACVQRPRLCRDRPTSGRVRTWYRSTRGDSDVAMGIGLTIARAWCAVLMVLGGGGGWKNNFGGSVEKDMFNSSDTYEEESCFLFTKLVGFNVEQLLFDCVTVLASSLWNAPRSVYAIGICEWLVSVKLLRCFDFERKRTNFCQNRFQTYSERLSSNFLAVHGRNVDQVDMPVLICIAVRKSVFVLLLKKKSKTPDAFICKQMCAIESRGECMSV